MTNVSLGAIPLVCYSPITETNTKLALQVLA